MTSIPGAPTGNRIFTMGLRPAPPNGPKRVITQGEVCRWLGLKTHKIAALWGFPPPFLDGGSPPWTFFWANQVEQYAACCAAWRKPVPPVPRSWAYAPVADPPPYDD